MKILWKNSIEWPLDSIEFLKSSNNSESILIRAHVQITFLMKNAKKVDAHGVEALPKRHVATLSKMLKNSHQVNTIAIQNHIAPSSKIRLRRSSKRRKWKGQNLSGDNSSITCMMEDAEDTMRVDQIREENIKEVREHRHQ